MGLLLLVVWGWGRETGVSGTLKRSDNSTGGGRKGGGQGGSGQLPKVSQGGLKQQVLGGDESDEGGVTRRRICVGE